MTEEVLTPTPLLAPSAGLPEVIATEESFSAAIAELGQGNGPFALDAERAHQGPERRGRAHAARIGFAEGEAGPDVAGRSAQRHQRVTLSRK